MIRWARTLLSANSKNAWTGRLSRMVRSTNRLVYGANPSRDADLEVLEKTLDVVGSYLELARADGNRGAARLLLPDVERYVRFAQGRLAVPAERRLPVPPCYCCSRPVFRTWRNLFWGSSLKVNGKSVTSCPACFRQALRTKVARILFFLNGGIKTHWSAATDYRPNVRYWLLNAPQVLGTDVAKEQTRAPSPPERLRLLPRDGGPSV